MSSTLYSFDATTKETLSKFKLQTSRASHLMAIILQIDSNQVISIQKTEVESPITSAADLVEELPDNSPRFIALALPIETEDGRQQSPYVLVYYRPETASQTNKMSYAGAVELLRNETGVSKVIEIEEADELEQPAGLIKG